MAKLLEVSPSTISATESGKSAVSTKLLLGYAYFCRYPLSRFADIDDVDIDENLKKTINKLFDDNGQKVLNSFLDVLSKTCTQN